MSSKNRIHFMNKYINSRFLERFFSHSSDKSIALDPWMPVRSSVVALFLHRV